MTSRNILPTRFTRIDELTRTEHIHLNDKDECWFLGEYTARRGYAFSETNSLILNFKKSVDKQNSPEWKHKLDAISICATAFRRALTPDALTEWTFVPVPPSEAKESTLYDDRLLKMLISMSPDYGTDIREMVSQTESTSPSHLSEIRLQPDDIEILYELVEPTRKSSPNIIAIVDDILTTGAHFKAMKNILSEHYPNASILGLFIARRVIPNVFEPYESD